MRTRRKSSSRQMRRLVRKKSDCKPRTRQKIVASGWHHKVLRLHRFPLEAMKAFVRRGLRRQ